MMTKENLEKSITDATSLMHRLANSNDVERAEKPNFKQGFIDRIRGLVNNEGCKVLLVKEPYLAQQFSRLAEELCLETQCYVFVVKDFDDIKELDEKAMKEVGWVRAESKSKILTLDDL